MSLIDLIHKINLDDGLRDTEQNGKNNEVVDNNKLTLAVGGGGFGISMLLSGFALVQALCVVMSVGLFDIDV